MTGAITRPNETCRTTCAKISVDIHQVKNLDSNSTKPYEFVSIRDAHETHHESSDHITPSIVGSGKLCELILIRPSQDLTSSSSDSGESRRAFRQRSKHPSVDRLNIRDCFRTLFVSSLSQEPWLKVELDVAMCRDMGTRLVREI